MRAVIYARFSSDLQRDSSLKDQTEVCGRLIEKEGWTLEKVYEDRAESGASRFRPAYQQLLVDAERGAFDVLVSESVDRLGRKLADVAALFDQLSYLGIKIHTVSTGEVTTLSIGMLGTMAQMYLSDLRDKTRRGQLGRVLQGKTPGGKAYGYDVVPPADPASKGNRGERRINPTEAPIVTRIFTEYAGGLSPRAIAKRFNAEGLPGPGGRTWRDTTIRGQFERGTGILNNPVYVGRLVWNRTSYVKNPKTGKRVARINPPDQHEVVAVPDLRILSDELWDKVKARQEQARFEIARDQDGNALNRVHRRKFMFSGLLVCGVCGGGYTVVGKDRYGCAAHRSKGTCANARTIKRQVIEGRVLAGLKDRLMAPELVEEFVAEFRREIIRVNRDAERQVASLRHELSTVGRKIEAMLRAIEDGMYNPAMKARMSELEDRQRDIENRLTAASPVRLHAKLPEIYRDKVARLEDALYEPDTKAEAMAIIRGLVDKIVLTPETDGMMAELHGDLAQILAFCDAADGKNKLPASENTGSQLSVVAGARNPLYRTFLVWVSPYRYRPR